MRILHVGKFFPPFAGGMELFLADLMAAQRRQGVTVAALVHEHRKTKQPSPEITAEGGRVYRIPCYGRLLYAPISPTFPFWLARTIREFQPDVLHLHVPNTSAFWVLFLPLARRIPCLIHWHADVVASQFDRRLAMAYPFYRPFEQRLLAHSDAVVATSPPYLESSLALRPWQGKCHIVALGLDPERIGEPTADALAQAESLWRQADRRLLSIGRLTYYKGHETLIRAVADSVDSRLIIVGNGEYRSRLERLIAQLGLHSRVLLCGYQPEDMLHALFASCDVLCLPSLERTEAFGMVLLEAMHFAKPVLASDIPGSGVGWVTRSGGHGIPLPPQDVQAWSRALDELLQSPERRRQFSQAGTSALHELFHIRQVAQRLTALYEKLLANR